MRIWRGSLAYCLFPLFLKAVLNSGPWPMPMREFCGSSAYIWNCTPLSLTWPHWLGFLAMCQPWIVSKDNAGNHRSVGWPGHCHQSSLLACFLCHGVAAALPACCKSRSWLPFPRISVEACCYLSVKSSSGRLMVL